MKAKNLFFIAGISLATFVPFSMSAQVGSSDNFTSTSSGSTDEQNAQRLFNLEEQLKDANKEVQKEKQDVKTAKANAREAKAALKSEKQAQKARKQANAQARKAEKAMN